MAEKQKVWVFTDSYEGKVKVFKEFESAMAFYIKELMCETGGKCVENDWQDDNYNSLTEVLKQKYFCVNGCIEIREVEVE